MVQRTVHKYCLLAAIVLTAAVGCDTSNGGGGSRSGKSGSKAACPVSFPYVTPPAIISGEQAASYCTEHYWDRFAHFTGPSDSTMLCGVARKDVEQAMANYIAILKSQPLDKAAAYVVKMTDLLISAHSADSTNVLLDSLGRLFERYCYDPNSPIRDEDIYSSYAQAMSGNAMLSAVERDRYAREAASSSLNRRGTKATDFTFSYKNGRRGHLYGIEAPKTLIFFSNPGCHACKEIMEVLSTQPGISLMVKEGTLAVVNIYIDEDTEGWLKYMPIYPAEWHNVFDSDYSIRGDELYDVRAIPSLYLLDADKTVLLKDVPPEELYGRLLSNQTDSK